MHRNFRAEIDMALASVDELAESIAAVEGNEELIEALRELRSAHKECVKVFLELELRARRGDEDAASILHENREYVQILRAYRQLINAGPNDLGHA